MSSVRRLGCFAFALLAALGSAGAGAQQIFRIVGPDGRVTFSDKPPAEAQGRATPAPTVAIPGGGGGAGGALPFELRSVTSRYPVTLYTGADCGPCVSGRNYLASRGIPFTERTISSDDDVQALIRLAGAPRLPVLTIGGQQLKGFSDSEWSQYLDAAGYPKTSQLPAGYRNPAPTPLVAVQAPRRADPEPQQADAQPPVPAAPLPGPAPSNPAGIRF